MKNRVPPPVWMILTGGLMWFVARSPLGLRSAFSYSAEVGTLLIALGIIVIVVGIVQFAKMGTTINPLDLTETTRLVTQGIFRWTRNPMYLGLTLILVGWGFHLRSPVNVVVVAAFVILITQWQIKPEEAALRRLFGNQFEAYCRRVRRWL